MPQFPSFGRAIFLLMLSVAPALAEQKSDTPADYAYALPLQVTGKQGVVGFRVPQSVYLHAKTAHLADLRVFDAKGIAQPYALHRPQPEIPEQHKFLTATIFAVRSDANPASGAAAFDLDIQTRPDGSVKSVQAHSGKAHVNNPTPLTSLLLDFGATPKGNENTLIEALRFTLPKGQTNYSAEIWLETSSNLKKWKTIGVAELSWLTNDSALTLSNDRLEFSPHAFRYARLNWRHGTPIQFAAIQAEIVTRQSSEPLRETLWIKPVAGKQPGDLAYPSGIALPVEQVSLKLTEPNIVFPLALGYYAERPNHKPGQPTEWIFQAQTRATFYQITQNGETRRSGALMVGLSHQNEWVIHPQNPAVTAQPELGLSWQPATLVFLAGGSRPYTLSFGRSDATPAVQALNQVAPGFTPDEFNQLEQAQAGELQTKYVSEEGDSAAVRASLSARNRTLILWGVLLSGVALLGGMAWRLVQQIYRASS